MDGPAQAWAVTLFNPACQTLDPNCIKSKLALFKSFKSHFDKELNDVVRDTDSAVTACSFTVDMKADAPMTHIGYIFSSYDMGHQNTINLLLVRPLVKL